MKILFLGDVVAKSGRQAVSLRLKALQQSCGAGFTIVNGENAAHGKGITARIYRAFKDDGVDVVTLGNHAFSKHEILDHLNECEHAIKLEKSIVIELKSLEEYKEVKRIIAEKVNQDLLSSIQTQEANHPQVVALFKEAAAMS